MNLYLISQETNTEYDTYDCAVVVAETEEAARKMNPDPWGKVKVNLSNWTEPENVTVTFLGVANPSLLSGSICGSFNAG